MPTPFFPFDVSRSEPGELSDDGTIVLIATIAVV